MCVFNIIWGGGTIGALPPGVPGVSTMYQVLRASLLDTPHILVLEVPL
jgi:hypothetical protein